VVVLTWVAEGVLEGVDHEVHQVQHAQQRVKAVALPVGTQRLSTLLHL
jgi:hypothetical protein